MFLIFRRKRLYSFSLSFLRIVDKCSYFPSRSLIEISSFFSVSPSGYYRLCTQFEISAMYRPPYNDNLQALRPSHPHYPSIDDEHLYGDSDINPRQPLRTSRRRPCSKTSFSSMPMCSNPSRSIRNPRPPTSENRASTLRLCRERRLLPPTGRLRRRQCLRRGFVPETSRRGRGCRVRRWKPLCYA